MRRVYKVFQGKAENMIRNANFNHPFVVSTVFLDDLSRQFLSTSIIFKYWELDRLTLISDKWRVYSKRSFEIWSHFYILLYDRVAL